MNDFIDIYCERIDPGFWDEPLNALTNISFFVTAFYAYSLAKKSGGVTRPALVLVFLLLCIGTGSFLFHTLATQWAQLTDVLPILFYQIAFLSLYSAHVMKAPPRATGRFIFLFFLTIAAFRQLPGDLLNGSIEYAPALIFLGYLAYWHYRHAAREKRLLLLATGTFLLSLTFRSLDMQFCPEMSAGLHFLWHILNGFLLYLISRAYILNAKR